MKRISFYTFIVLLVFSLINFQIAYAQTKTAEELKAEREALKSEMKSKEVEERAKKFEKLKEPGQSGIQVVDDLSAKSAQMLISAKETNLIIPEMYKRTIGETIDGVTDVTVKKPTLEEIMTLAGNIALQVEAVAAASKSIASAADGIKSASPLQAPKAKKGLDFSKDVISLIGPELQLSQKVVQHLITTIKSSKNY